MVLSVALRALLGLAVWGVATLALRHFEDHGIDRTLTLAVEVFAAVPMLGLYITEPPRRRVGCAVALVAVPVMAVIGFAVQLWLRPTLDVGFQAGEIVGVPVGAALFALIVSRAKAARAFTRAADRSAGMAASDRAVGSARRG
ncbi:hypothetical protein ACIA7S_41780 [Streptomyces sp. NPDC051643]|uniref:hypothetical protein n=1 Tax=Streptomyces sp. NPDC051643 TaxID=3365665 RepID=UPI00143EBF03|nr:hypothetical protein [Streptomyces sp. RPA4-2]QIY66102.1 hypothetical protein HEP85_36755 [Streptomyces sp. RPA4-2]